MKQLLSAKQLEAIERQEIYDSLSLSKKIAQCRSRRGNSAKELKRLRASEKLL
jgi:hypothetical protein